MKYKEFREYLTFYNIYFREDEEKLEVGYRIEISKIEEHRIVIPTAIVYFPEEFDLIKKAIELAETPLDEREEED